MDKLFLLKMVSLLKYKKEHEMNNDLKFDKYDFEYLDYIVEHKKNLFKAYNQLVKCKDNLYLTDSDLKMMKDKCIEYDISKFSVAEFTPYCDNFYRNKKDSFNLAWKHHYENNDHHPEGMISYSNYKLIEMCLDWYAMSLKFNDNPLEYFKNKKDKLKKYFDDEALRWIEEILTELIK